jgi:hypothetical protein
VKCREMAVESKQIWIFVAKKGGGVILSGGDEENRKRDKQRERTSE